MAKFTDSLITHGLILLGLVLMVTPLALWVAWTKAIFLGVLATGAIALVLYGVLQRFERPADSARSDTPVYVRGKLWPYKLIVELQKLHPFIHHHRPSGSPKFQMAMFHLKKRLF